MKIYAIQDAETFTTKLDLDAFTTDLRELTVRYPCIQLVSIGAMSGLEMGGTGAMYLAIWAPATASDEPAENEGIGVD